MYLQKSLPFPQDLFVALDDRIYDIFVRTQFSKRKVIVGRNLILYQRLTSDDPWVGIRGGIYIMIMSLPVIIAMTTMHCCHRRQHLQNTGHSVWFHSALNLSLL